jgi:diguanylate cyclase (GGDEF)-like protein
MLSESTRTTGNDYGAALLPLMHARGPRARWAAIGAGAGIIVVLSALLPLMSPELPITALFLVPVVVVSWWAGRWAAMWAAFAAASSRLLIDLAAGLPYSAPTVPYWNFGIGLAVFLAVARVLPGLRDTVFRDREQAITDPLTSLGNRRLFTELASIELNRTRRYQRPLALLYMNIDKFEKFNERHGYAEGDSLLVLTASMVKGCLRTSDVVARIAGDEFAVLLPETPAEGAHVAVEKIHQHVSKAAADAGYPVTFSMAVVTYMEGPVTLEGVLRQADSVMFSVKREGGNAIGYEEYAHPMIAAL